LEQYEELFEEHLDLFMKLNAQDRVTWSGRFRSALKNAAIAPRPAQDHIPIWVGVGGTPESAARAGRYGTGLALAILGGSPMRFKPLVDIYREAAREAGHPQEALKVGVTGHAYISETTQKAKEEFYPYYSNYWDYVNRQRGMSSSRMSVADFERMAAPDTALFVGSSQQVTEKILQQYELFGHQRFIAQMDIGGIPFDKIAKNIERLAVEVAPIVRRETSKR
jgi:alkanesulfonate monooxygenase SsuD/methylene tetrahydromethanopterin reductase-like flavin-dependent oxidoreductase (luciferase family)